MGLRLAKTAAIAALVAAAMAAAPATAAKINAPAQAKVVKPLVLKSVQDLVISAPNVTMVNQSNSSKTLTLKVDSPGTVMLTNSGAQGQDFPIGGTVTVDSTTAGGIHVGTFEVTAEYQ